MGPLVTDPSSRRLCFCSISHAAAFLCFVFILGTSFVVFDYEEKVSTGASTDFVGITRGTSEIGLSNLQARQADSWSHDTNLGTTGFNSCKSTCISSGSEPLPKGIVCQTSDMEMVPLWGPPNGKENNILQKSLLAMPVGIKQKEIVNQIIIKFASSDFTIILFHYDGVVDEWKDLQWSGSALHISAINQTKWWFAKRFLHPDIVAPYKYVFLWDEDLEVENFHPEKYLAIVEREGLEISQPALEPAKSRIHHQITVRSRKGDVHRCCRVPSRTDQYLAIYFVASGIYSILLSDLIHAWGLDMKLGYCAQGDRSKNVGVVDSEYIVHKGLPTLGWFDDKTVSSERPAANNRYAVRQRSYVESEIFRKRWQKAVSEDNCWSDPYPEPKTNPGR